MPYFVSRQVYWGVETEDACVVEVTGGGRDHANPDMLTPYFPGEGQEYADPREAVKVASEIRKQWQARCEDQIIKIGVGFTGGMTMPFEGRVTSWDAVAWAQEQWEQLEKCAYCGDPLPGKSKRYRLIDSAFEEEFCSSNCAERAAEHNAEENTPPCARSMGCLCAGHARGDDPESPCDTDE